MNTNCVRVCVCARVNALITTTIDLDSTAVRLLTKGHQGHSDVTRAADPLYSHADLFIYLGLSAAAAAQW